MKRSQHIDLPEEMNALFCEAYGGYQNIQVKTCPLPKIAADEILIQTVASSITRADSLMRSGKPKFGRIILGWKKPKQPMMGTGFSGRVIAKGKDVSQFDLLDEVFGETATCLGANAEFIAIKESAVIVKKTDLSRPSIGSFVVRWSGHFLQFPPSPRSNSKTEVLFSSTGHPEVWALLLFRLRRRKEPLLLEGVIPKTKRRCLLWGPMNFELTIWRESSKIHLLKATM